MIGALIRVSSDPQETKAQFDEINAHTEPKGIHIDRYFNDKESRDNSDNRPEFQEAIRLVMAGILKVLFVQKLDRFGITDSDEWGHYRWLFRQHGCKIISVAEGDLTATDTATKITTSIKADGSAEEQRNISHRGLTGRAVKAKEGEWVGGPSPFGYDKMCLDAQRNLVWRLVKVTPEHHIQILPDGTLKHLHGRGVTPRKPSKTDKLTLAINDEQAAVVREIFRLWTTTLISPLGIATKLNREGQRIHGKPFKQATIKRILRNRRYLGCSIWNEIQMGRFKEYKDGRPILISEEMRRTKMRGKKKKYILRHNTDDQLIIKEGAWPAIIDLPTSQYAREKLKKMKDNKTRIPRNHLFWLKDLVICGGCSKPMLGEVHKDVAWYCCRNFVKADKSGLADHCSCSRNTIKAEVVEKLLKEWLEERRLSLERLTDLSHSTSMVEAMKGEIKEFKEHLQQWGPHGSFPDCRAGWERYFSRMWTDFGLDDLAEPTPGQDVMSKGITYLRQVLDTELFKAFDTVKCKEAQRIEADLKRQLTDIVTRKASSRSELEEEVWIRKQDDVEARIRRMQEWAVPYEKRLQDAKHKLREFSERADSFYPDAMHHQERGEAVRRLVKRIVLDICAEPNHTGLIAEAIANLGAEAKSRDIRAWLIQKHGVDLPTKNIATLRKRSSRASRKHFVLKGFHIEGVFSGPVSRQSSASGAVD